MRNGQNENVRSSPCNESDVNQLKILVIGFTLPLLISLIPTSVDAMGQLLPLPPSSPYEELQITCSKPVMTAAPKFLSTPKGSARYPFSMECTSPLRSGLMIFTWEGSWNPSETRRDRPNTAETLTITGYEPFIPGRTPGGKIFMYWTGSCTADPWIMDGSCSRFGAYVPEDMRGHLPNIDGRPFPLTEDAIPPSQRPRLVQMYQKVNQPVSNSIISQYSPSKQPNTIVVNPSKTIDVNPSVPLTISNMKVASGKPYMIPASGLRVGGLLYIDRTFTFTTVPPLVQGQTFIQTANNDKASTTANFLSFTVNQPVSVYVAYDLRIPTKPTWLSAFSDTGTNMVTSDTTLRLFVRSFPAGQITLGGNTGGFSMYSVVVKPSQTQTMGGQSSGGQSSSMLSKPSSAISGSLRGSAVTQSRIFRRGIDQSDSQQSDPPEPEAEMTPNDTSAATTSDGETEEITETAALRLDRPLHVTSAKGDTIMIEPGIYEVEPVLGLHLGLAQEGYPTLILLAKPGTHNESIKRTMVMVIPGQSDDEQHLVLLTPDGQRFEVPGSLSGIQSRGTGMVATLPDNILKDAIIQASERSASEPSPPCHQNPEPIGPRWLPVPCSMPTTED
jgi:hypothetical protein